MQRSRFLKMLAALPFASTMKLNDLYSTATSFRKSDKMPVLFVGHGSPMNALEDNSFTQTLQNLGQQIRLDHPPTAILVVSAHWLTKGSFATLNPMPETIHDFGGFPQALFDMQYPAPGSPEFAQQLIDMVPDVHGSDEWGLDHGSWTILHHLFPQADIPVFQLSLDYTKPLAYHFELAQQLQFLRERGVLIIGSGNIVHNLRLSVPKLMMNDNTPHDWAVEFDAWVKNKIDQRDFRSLVNYQQTGQAGALAVPTVDHYLPVLYSLGATEAKEPIKQVFEEVSYGGLSMRTFMAG
ncbi:4,5-DOPA-extradiol-dioxygenase [Hymenobacter crusticola]|nr:4,5-DOPA dioxygenase extradiol [Hymenobacter crusticola]